MSKHSQVTKERTNAEHRQKVEAVGPARHDDAEKLAISPTAFRTGEFWTTALQGMSSIHRQAMLLELNRVHGNRHVQRVAETLHQAKQELADGTARSLEHVQRAWPVPETSDNSLLQQIHAIVRQAQEAWVVGGALLQGIRDENELTNLVFFVRHPERRGQKLTPADPQFEQLSKEWLSIRDDLIRPVLSRTSPTSPNEPETPTSPKEPEAPEQKEFLERVLNAHIASSTSKSKNRQPRPDLTDAELGDVPHTGIQMRKDAASAAGSLLAAANGALEAARAVGEPDALRTTRITANSGYRNRAHQERLWRTYFPGYYNDTADHRKTLPGGEHGDAAVSYMVEYIRGRIAAPGFSNHQAGLAIDFLQQRTKGNEIRNKTKVQWVRKWEKTWFFKWLQSNAKSFNFEPYEKEPWHWVYNPPT